MKAWPSSAGLRDAMDFRIETQPFWMGLRQVRAAVEVGEEL